MELENIFVKLERQYAEIKDGMEKNLEQVIIYNDWNWAL